MINILVKVKNVMNKILSAASVVLLVFMTSLVLWQVFTRYVLGKPAAFTEELVKYSLMWTAFIGAAYAFFTRDHMSLTIIKDKLTGNKRKILLLVIDVLILLLAVFVFVIGGFKLAMSARAEYSALLGIPRTLVYAVSPVSGIFIVVAQIINIYEDLTGVKVEYEVNMSIAVTTVILFVVFGVLLFLGVPISVSIIASSIVTAMSTLSWDQITFITMQKMNSGVESFSLLAVPLFILAGNIMNNGGIAKRLINFAQIFVGKIPGNLAQANILANMLFGALSGSSVAAASAIGGCMSPIEKEQKYDPAYAAAANIASAPTGLLIPPTSAFIVYSTVAGGVSISTLFMAGYVPGILMGVVCMIVAFIGAKRLGIKAVGRDKSVSILKIFVDAIPSLLLIIIVIGGIVSGIFTATEGAGIAVLYCLILSIIYKSMNFKTFVEILKKSAKVSGVILFLISASSAMSFVMAYSGIPAAISNGLLSISTNKVVIFLLMNIILLVVGMFMDITPAILIFTPIFLPIAQSFGMTDIQFGVMLIFNMCLGNITPPVGSVLFVGCGIENVSIEKVTPKLIPYFIGLIILLMLITFIPELSLGVPKLMGLI